MTQASGLRVLSVARFSNESLVGSKVPSVKVATWQDGPRVIEKSDEMFANKKMVVFAIPGAYTPTCQNKHMPSFISNLDGYKVMSIQRLSLHYFFTFVICLLLFIVI